MNTYWKNKKILITGASGFIGSNACSYFSQLGSTVTAVVSSRRRTGITNLSSLRVNSIITKEVDLLSAEQVRDLTNGQDIVLHFAGVDGGLMFKRLHSADIFSRNMRMNLNILEASAHSSKSNDCIVLLVSSADIYTHRGNSQITEDTQINIDLKNEIDGYKLAKWTTELAMREYHRQYKTNYILIRPSNIYGPGDEFKDDDRVRLIPATIKHVLQSQPISIWGDGSQLRSFLFVTDFLSICARLIEKGVYNTPINIASSQNVTLLQLAELVLKLSGQHVPIHTDLQKPAGVPSRTFDLSRLYDAIGSYKEVPLSEGLSQTIEFYKTHYSA